MMKKLQKRIVIPIIVAVLCISGALMTVTGAVFAARYTAQGYADMVDSGIDYTESTAQLRNPARGPSLDTGMGTIMSGGALTEINHGNRYQYTIQRFYLGLGAYKETPIPQEYLLNLERALDEARRLELMVIMAFQYHGCFGSVACSSCKSVPQQYCINEPTLDIIFEHIDQLCVVLGKYPDVLYNIMTTMIGPWGEQHSTLLSQDGISMARFTQKWLDATKENGLPAIQISMRGLRSYINWYNWRNGTHYTRSSMNYIPDDLSGTDGYRIGFWNDVLHAGAASCYMDKDIEMEWMEQRTSRTLFGGEPGGGSKPWAADSRWVEYAMYKTPVSYLRDATGMSDQWMNMIYNGANPIYNNATITSIGYNYGSPAYIGPTRMLDWIRLHLGYRFVVRESLVSETISVDRELRLTGKIENVGFAPIMVKTKASIIIADGDTPVHEVPANVDLNSGVYDVTVTLPSTLGNGQYTAYLKVWRDKSGTPNDTQNEIIAFANRGEYAHIIRHWGAGYTLQDHATSDKVIFNNDSKIRANKLVLFSINNSDVSVIKPEQAPALPNGVRSVTVNDPTWMTLKRGDTYQFRAPTVTGGGNPSQSVVWSVEGNAAQSVNLGTTTMTQAGLLSIDPNLRFVWRSPWSETNPLPPWTIRVHARSVADHDKIATISIFIHYRSVFSDGEDHNFGSLLADYKEPPPEYMVTITNTGVTNLNSTHGNAAAVSATRIELSGINPDSFELSRTNFATPTNSDCCNGAWGKMESCPYCGLNPGRSIEFTVRPKAGLSPGTYTAIVAVLMEQTHADVSAQTFEVRFTAASTCQNPCDPFCDECRPPPPVCQNPCDPFCDECRPPPPVCQNPCTPFCDECMPPPPVCQKPCTPPCAECKGGSSLLIYLLIPGAVCLISVPLILFFTRRNK